MKIDLDHEIDYYSREKTTLIKDNKARNDKFAAMDNMAHNILPMPQQLTNIEGFHKVIPTGPANALNTAKRILSSVEPHITFHPLDSTPDTRDRSDDIEKALMWHYKRAANRSSTNLTADVVMSAARYDEIAIQVIYLPWQNKLSGLGNPDKWDDGGDFSLILHKPSNIYTKRTHMGLNVVLLRSKLTPDDVIDTWGDAAAKVIDAYAETNGREKIRPENVIYCDRWDKKYRLVWLEFGDESSAAEIEEKNIIIAEPHKLPFIPWVCMAGGSALDKEPEHQRQPLLNSVYQARSWLTEGIVASLIVTEAIKTAAAPLTFSNTVNGKSPKIDYTNIGGNVALGMNEHIAPMQKPHLDERLETIKQQIEDDMGSSTVPKVLSNPSFSAKAAFAAVNAILHAASNVLDPLRGLSERALAGVFSLNLKWLIFSKKPLYAYDFTDKKSPTYGNQIMVDNRALSPSDIYITVELTPKLPLDKIGEINAVSLLKKEFGISKERAMEMLDFTDAETLIEEGVQEAMNDAEIGKVIAVITAEGQAAAKDITDAQALQTQQKQMDMQQQAQQAQMEQQQQAQQQAQQQQQPPQGGDPSQMQGPSAQGMPQMPQPPQGQDPMTAMQGQAAPQMQQQQAAQSAAGVAPDQAASILSQITDNMKGPAFDPSKGGQSPSGAQPGALTREKKKRKTQGGAPIVGA